jgi:two-component system cell cycle sensor histidine kinase/response regulator CckA
MNRRPRFGRAPLDAEALLAALPQPMALVDAQGQTLSANAAFRAALGTTRSWRSGAPAADILPLAADVLATALAARAEVRVAFGEGRHLRILPLAEAGAVLCIEAPPTRTEAPRLEILGRLAGGIAHDFNNLLSLILGAVALARRTQLPAAVGAELDAIEAAADRGAGLVRQLLAFARQQVMEPRVVLLNEAVRQLAGLLPRLLGPGVTIDLALEEPSRRVRVDPLQLDQVVLNLAVNASEAMGGKGRLRIATGRRLVLRPEPGSDLPPGRWAVLEVADNGPGMTAEAARRLFEPFFTTKLASGGTGLGLATVQGIVEQSGGRIELRTSPGRGATFRIYLPRHDGPEDTPEEEPQRPAQPQRGLVLFVEDEPALARLGRFALEQAGHEVLTAEDGETALSLLEAGARPALIVSDVAMPGLDGLGLARAARLRWPDLPVLLLSGYAASAVSVDLRAEKLRFLSKPYTPEVLCRAVASALAEG